MEKVNYKPKQSQYSFKKYLGKIKGTNQKVFLGGFVWDCGWYWAGGYLGNKDMHTHFDSCFLETPDYRGHSLGDFSAQSLSNGCAVWEDLDKFLDDAQYMSSAWWRIKDLYKQFYTLKNCAEVFQFGGNCTSDDRNPKEINYDMAMSINAHIESVIIPEIIKVLELGQINTKDD
jgi:hypothetical protein